MSQIIVSVVLVLVFVAHIFWFKRSVNAQWWFAVVLWKHESDHGGEHRAAPQGARDTAADGAGMAGIAGGATAPNSAPRPALSPRLVRIGCSPGRSIV